MNKIKYFFGFVLIGAIFLFLSSSYFTYLDKESEAEHNKAIFTVKRIKFIHSFVKDYLKSCKNINYNKLDNLAFISDTDFIQNNCSDEFFKHFNYYLNKDYSLDGWGRKFQVSRSQKSYIITSYGSDGIKGDRDDYTVSIDFQYHEHE